MSGKVKKKISSDCSRLKSFFLQQDCFVYLDLKCLCSGVALKKKMDYFCEFNINRL